MDQITHVDYQNHGRSAIFDAGEFALAPGTRRPVVFLSLANHRPSPSPMSTVRRFNGLSSDILQLLVKPRVSGPLSLPVNKFMVQPFTSYVKGKWKTPSEEEELMTHIAKLYLDTKDERFRDIITDMQLVDIGPFSPHSRSKVKNEKQDRERANHPYLKNVDMITWNPLVIYDAQSLNEETVGLLKSDAGVDLEYDRPWGPSLRWFTHGVHMSVDSDVLKERFSKKGDLVNLIVLI